MVLGRDRQWLLVALCVVAWSPCSRPGWQATDAGLPKQGQYRSRGCWLNDTSFVAPPPRKTLGAVRVFEWREGRFTAAPLSTGEARIDYGAAACRGDRVALAMHLTGLQAGTRQGNALVPLPPLPALSSQSIVWWHDDEIVVLADVPAPRGLRSFTLVGDHWNERVLDANAVGEQLTALPDGETLVWLSREAHGAIGVYAKNAHRELKGFGTALAADGGTVFVALTDPTTKTNEVVRLDEQWQPTERWSQPQPLHALVAAPSEAPQRVVGVREDSTLWSLLRDGRQQVDPGALHCTARHATFLPKQPSRLLVAYADEDEAASRLGCHSQGGLVLYEWSR